MNYSLRRWSGYCFAILAAIAASCAHDDETRQADLPADYFPLQTGAYLTYDIDEIRYTLGVPETLAYELKTMVVDSFSLANGTLTYTIYRYKRTDSQAAWTYLDTWSANVDKREAIVNEANIQFLKFKVPVDNGQTWDGNKYNDQGEDLYTMEDVKLMNTYSGMAFNDCVTIVQSDNGDHVVFLDERKEIYSRNVGMIYKEMTQLHYCTDTDRGCIGLQIVDEGVIFRQTIKAYGTE